VGLDFAAYERDELVRDGVERRLGIVGEALAAAARLEPLLQVRLPELGQAVGPRNRIIHDYDAVDDGIVWDVVRHKLPALEVGLAIILRERGETP